MTFEIKEKKRRFYAPSGEQLILQLEIMPTIPFRFHITNSRPQFDIDFIDAKVVKGQVTLFTQRGNQLSEGGLFEYLQKWLKDELKYNRDLLYNNQEKFLITKTNSICARMKVLSDTEPYEFEISFPKMTKDDTTLSNHRLVAKKCLPQHPGGSYISRSKITI